MEREPSMTTNTDISRPERTTDIYAVANARRETAPVTGEGNAHRVTLKPTPAKTAQPDTAKLEKARLAGFNTVEAYDYFMKTPAEKAFCNCSPRDMAAEIIELDNDLDRVEAERDSLKQSLAARDAFAKRLERQNSELKAECDHYKALAQAKNVTK